MKRQIKIWQLPVRARWMKGFPKFYEPDLIDYVLVWKGNVETSADWLNDCWKIFNINHPKDYYAKSLSVGDLIQDGDDFYFVDSCGFKKTHPKSW